MPDLPTSTTSRTPPTSGRPGLSWFARRRRAAADAAARRTHDDLVARGLCAAETLTSTAVAVFSVVVLAAAAAAVGLLLWATVVPKGMWGWVGVSVGWVVVVALAPRPVRVDDAIELARALLSHELGHLRGRDTGRAALVGQAHTLLQRFATLLTPLPRDAVSDFEVGGWNFGTSTATMNGVGRVILTVVSLPAVLLLLAFERAASRDSQAREYAADLRAAEVAGTQAMVRLMLSAMGVAGMHTLASAAVRRRDDPFEALATVRDRGQRTSSEVARARTRAREEDLRWDDTHPRDDLRLSVLEAHSVAPAIGALAARRALVREADVELVGLRPTHARALRDELLETWL